MAKSKFFRVAVEGATTDGRNIERSWIADMAATYSLTTYGARVNLEHYRGILPDGPFRAYGDVVALKAEEVTEGALKGKLALYAQVEPTPDLVEMVKRKQKIYTSIEISTKFASTGRPYLLGLAVTDSPASLGTEMLTFAASHPDANPLSGRKQSQDNLFSVADAVDIQWEEESPTSALGDLYKQVRERLEKLSGKIRSHDGQITEVVEALHFVGGALDKVESAQTAATQVFTDKVQSFANRLDQLEASNNKTSGDLAELIKQLASVSDFKQRPASTGGGINTLTDC